MSGGVDSSVVLRLLSDLVSEQTSTDQLKPTARFRLTIQPVKLHVTFMRNWDPLLSENQDVDQDQAAFDFKYKLGSASSSGGVTHQCEWERDWEDVCRTTDHIGLSRDNVRLVDFTKEYWSKVFEPAIGVWEGGGTPNPDIDCNRYVSL
jgi:tRNA U34 2-thiouridine synthase MnmA/TrmU